jgi:plastocyanin
MKTALLIALGAAKAVSAAATDASAAAHTVMIENMRFSPARLVVAPGDRVTWTNKDFFPHTASAVAGAFDSHSIPANASWTYVASKPGEYDYVCRLHPTMRAKLIVRSPTSQNSR